MAKNENLTEWWNKSINPITGFKEMPQKFNPYRSKIYSIPVRNKSKYSN